MAEIKVEPKRAGLSWLWIVILLVVIAAGVWYFVAGSRPVPAPASPADSTRTSLVSPPAAAFAEATNG